MYESYPGAIPRERKSCVTPSTTHFTDYRQRVTLSVDVVWTGSVFVIKASVSR